MTLNKSKEAIFKLWEEQIRKAAIEDYQKQTKYDNAFDRQKGFIEGVRWAIDKNITVNKEL